jgi:hypothetical protein
VWLDHPQLVQHVFAEFLIIARYTRHMTIQGPGWSRLAPVPEMHWAGVREYNVYPLPPPLVDGPMAASARDPEWPWPRALRLAILISGTSWFLIAFAVWAFLLEG